MYVMVCYGIVWWVFEDESSTSYLAPQLQRQMPPWCVLGLKYAVTLRRSEHQLVVSFHMYSCSVLLVILGLGVGGQGQGYYGRGFTRYGGYGPFAGYGGSRYAGYGAPRNRQTNMVSKQTIL